MKVTKNFTNEIQFTENQISRNFTEVRVFHRRRPISRKMSPSGNGEL